MKHESPLERTLELQDRLAPVLMEYVDSAKFLSIDIEDFAAIRALPDGELWRLKSFIPFLRATVRQHMRTSYTDLMTPKRTVLYAAAAGWVHKILREKATLLSTQDVVTICLHMKSSHGAASRAVRELRNAEHIFTVKSDYDGRVDWVFPTKRTVRALFESCLYFNIIRAIEAASFGGPDYKTFYSKTPAAEKMYRDCEKIYERIYADVEPQHRVIVGDPDYYALKQ